MKTIRLTKSVNYLANDGIMKSIPSDTILDFDDTLTLYTCTYDGKLIKVDRNFCEELSETIDNCCLSHHTMNPDENPFTCEQCKKTWEVLINYTGEIQQSNSGDDITNPDTTRTIVKDFKRIIK